MKKNRLETVYIVGPTFGLEHVFPDYGYKPLTDGTLPYHEGDIDIICFTGGSDINPRLYHQNPLPSTHYSNSRDIKEIAAYQKYKSIPKLGICRGAQLINVLNGGSLWQNVDHHIGADHTLQDIKGRNPVVCSIHHQMMRRTNEALLVAWTKLSTFREDETGRHPRKSDDIDAEVLFYPKDKALLFQSHPEFGPKSCTDYFFTLVEEYIQP